MGRTSITVTVPEPRKLPSGKWFIQLRIGGKSYSFTDSSKTKCRDAAARFKTQYKIGLSDISSIPTSEKSLDKLMEEFITSKEKTLSPSTITGYEVIRRNRFKNYINKKPSAIKDWQTVIDDEIDNGISAKTIKNAWSLVEASLKKAKLPVPDVTLPQVIQVTRPWLDADQIQIFVKAVHGTSCEIPALLALHSLRRSEILGLTWDKIDLKNDVIRVEGSAVPDVDNNLVFKETNKTQKSRRQIPIMIPELKTALLAVPEHKRNGRIYTCYQNKLWEQVNKVCEQNNLPLVGVHGLRHSFASLAYHVGLDELTTMQLGGWETAQTMTKIYTHVSESDKLKASNKMKDFYQNLQIQNKNANENANEG